MELTKIREEPVLCGESSKGLAGRRDTEAHPPLHLDSHGQSKKFLGAVERKGWTWLRCGIYSKL